MFKRNIPNALTCGNLLCGCFAIIRIFENDLIWAAYFVGIALLFDFLDGFAARLLKATSPIGKDLDSLADMVTFGIVPGMIMFKLISITGGYFQPDINLGVKLRPSILPYVAMVIPVFSAIRLARFNNDARQTDSFIGFPTPANALLIAAFPLIFHIDSIFLSTENIVGIERFFLDPLNLCIICCLLSLLLVSEFTFFSLKFKNLSWTENKIRYIYLGLSLPLLYFKAAGIALIILLFIVMSLAQSSFGKSSS